jgi:predicted nucleic acid-binding protein
VEPHRLLIDSSVWIEYYRLGGPEPLRRAVRQALTEDAVVTTGLIVAEVVQGAKTEAAYSLLWDDMTALPWLEINPAVVQQAARWGFSLQRQGTAVPATDLLIAAVAVEHSCRLWHLDAHFERIASLAPLVAERPA